MTVKNSNGKIVKSIPASENGSLLTCLTRSGQKYLITQCTERNRFTLWKENKVGYEKIDTGSSPFDFDDILGYI